MAFEGFKKFMGMIPPDEDLEDDEDTMQDELDGEEESVAYSYGGDTGNLDSTGGTGPYSSLGSSFSSGREESSKVARIHDDGQLQVVLVKPERFEDASTIADHLQAKRTVVVNTDSLAQDVRRRRIDFLSGVAYADGGTIKKASNTTFVITPSTVGVMGDSTSEDSDSSSNNGIYY